MLIRLALAAALAAPITGVAFQGALAGPSRIIILRHGEKADAWRPCAVGEARAAALAAHYLGRGAANSLFAPGQSPEAFLAITLHTLELASPAVASWGQPLILYSVVPTSGMSKPESTLALNRRTQEAARDLMTNPRWQGKIVVMVWEHDHIAHEKLEQEFKGQEVTLRQLLKLDRLEDVPRTWPGSNYDYFWIVDYAAGSDVPTSFRMLKQTFPAAYANVPANDWATPDGLTPASGCEG
jgi:hypothetical protein